MRAPSFLIFSISKYYIKLLTLAYHRLLSNQIKLKGIFSHFSWTSEYKMFLLYAIVAMEVDKICQTYLFTSNSMTSLRLKAPTTDQGSDSDYLDSLAPKNAHRISTTRSNRLPVNLFHSTTEYSKMLITNGKCLKQKEETQIDGFYDDLEFINQPLFQSSEQKQLLLKQKLETQTSPRKRAQSSTVQCSCCCCENYCTMCSQLAQKNIDSTKKHQKLTPAQLKVAVERVEKKINKNLKKKKNTIISAKYGLSGNKNSAFTDNIVKTAEKEASSSYLSHKSANIDNLICGSLILFEERKRQQKVKKIREQHQKKERISLLKQFNDEIRQNNRSLSKSQHNSSKKVRKSKTKGQLRLDYWKSIKNDVAAQVMKTRLSGGANLEGTKPKKQDIHCNHHPKLTQEEMEQLKKQYQKEARYMISKEKQAKKREKKRIKSNLKKVDDKSTQILKSLPKKQFKPTQKTINEAFTNLD